MHTSKISLSNRWYDLASGDQDSYVHSLVATVVIVALLLDTTVFRVDGAGSASAASVLTIHFIQT